ncbi:MAG TPA: 4-alpha-glucanotransferase [Candidatus Xenobia bacterium]
MNIPRSSGILLHPTSLPGPYGIGDLGPAARGFVDFLARSGQTLWQMLPIGPAGPLNSPYSAPSAFAGNVLMISPELLAEQGLLPRVDGGLPNDTVDFGAVIPFKMELLSAAWATFRDGRGGPFARLNADFEAFKGLHGHWLPDYALFRALKDVDESRVWHTWDPPLAKRDASALRDARAKHAEAIEKHCFLQFIFFQQWDGLREYCRQKHVRLIGDIPIFVAYDSADVWSHPEFFKLDAGLNPTVVSGVPPDYFSPTGQLWGTPLYNWEALGHTDFSWWAERLQHMMDLVDFVRIDHFRGFAACWEVPYGSPTAEYGQWVPVPGNALFTALKQALGTLPVIAEDLGLITPDVHALRDGFGFPGMRILQFAFSSSGSVEAFLPFNYVRNTVAYTGTHDNNTTRGWYRGETESCREAVCEYFTYNGVSTMSQGDFDNIVSWMFIREVSASVAQMALYPLQDLLGQAEQGRMNFPSDDRDIWWRWRFDWDELTESLADRLYRLTELHGRLRPKFPRRTASV